MAKRSVSLSEPKRAYDDIDPPTHFFSEEKWDRYVVDLSGWKREKEFDKSHLRVRLDDKKNIRMSGERPISADRSIRFERVFQLPERHDSAGITAKFYNGILTVVVPKSPPPPPPPSPTTSPTPPPATPPAPTPETTKDQEKEEEATPTPKETVESGEMPVVTRRCTAAIAAVTAAAILIMLVGFYAGNWMNSSSGEVAPLEMFMEDY